MAMRKEFDIEDEESQRVIGEELARESTLVQDRQAMALKGQADSNQAFAPSRKRQGVANE
jgi:hypothetical protein